METGVRAQVLRAMRMCQFGKADIGDEFYFYFVVLILKKNVKKY